MRAIIVASLMFISLSTPHANAAEVNFSTLDVAPFDTGQVQIALSREQRITRERGKRATAERRRADIAGITERHRKQLQQIAFDASVLAERRRTADLEAKTVAKELRKTRNVRVDAMIAEYRQGLDVLRDQYIGKPGPMGIEARKRKRALNIKITQENQLIITGIQKHQQTISDLDRMIEAKYAEKASLQKQLDDLTKKVRKIDKEISKIDRKLRRLGARNVAS